MREPAFADVRGMDLAKKALMCAAVDDGIKGVLIRGPSGTAKSVLVRAFSRIVPDRMTVEVPPSISEEDMFGGLDVEATVREGRRMAVAGLLSRADGGFLHIDNVNLIDPRLLSSVTECVLSGRVSLERGAVSAEYTVDTTLLATMDPVEGELTASVADRFDICISILPERDAAVRADIVAAGLGLTEASDGDAEVAERIRTARGIVGGIAVDRATALRIAGICAGLEVPGHRGELAMARTARALAALRGARDIADEDLRDAGIMCLSHRASAEGDDDDGLREAEPIPDIPEDPHEGYDEDFDDDYTEVMEVYDELILPDVQVVAGEPPGEEEEDTLLEEIRDELGVIADFENIRLHEIVGAGRHRQARTVAERKGRQRGDRIPEGRPADPALGATVREAAPYQRIRSPGGGRMVIESQDIRDKVRIKRETNAFLFMVDVSGSLAVGNMMNIIHQAIRAMLAESYIKRDKVALMTFRADRADIAVPFTRSVETICRTLSEAPVGEATPLNLALTNARTFMLNHQRKYPGENCHIVLITDGQGNVPLARGAQPLPELRRLATTMDLPGTTWTVIDSGFGNTSRRDAPRLAGWLGARYVRMSDLGDY